jgi:pyruvate dehydrogenase E2 component (dihydrolipoamide acetyltransferase)
LVEKKEDIAAFADFVVGGAPSESAAEESIADPSASSSSPTQQSIDRSASSGDRRFVSPLAKKMAGEKNVDLSLILGTGPNNRIIAADIDDALVTAQTMKQAEVVVTKVTPPAPTAATTKKAELPNHMFTDIENSQIRKIIAERLTHSK